MFVRLLIGRQAGGIVDLPFHAATASIDSGTAVAATGEEIAAAGFEVPARAAAIPESLPPGYVAVPHEAGSGFTLKAPDGTVLNEAPIANLVAARGMACNHANGLAVSAQATTDMSSLTVAELKVLAAGEKIDLTGATKKDDIIAAIELAREARAKAPQLTAVDDGAGAFNVVDASGKQINTDPLTREAADALIAAAAQ